MESLLCRFLTIFFCYCSFAVTSDAANYRSDYTYNQNAQGYLKYHDIPATWLDARQRCYDEGAILASPLNFGLSDAIIQMMHRTCPTCKIFTGIRDTYARQEYSSLEGVPLSVITHTWDSVQNDSDEDVSCIVLHPNGRITIKNCDDKFHYMCYKKVDKSFKLNECGTTDDEYTFDSRTGSCYKFHHVLANWTEAYKTCMLEFGHLIIINSEEEAQVVRDIYARIPVNLRNTLTFSGFRDWSGKGEFWTIDGKTLKEAGYDKFAAGEPNNKGIQLCGGIYPNGRIDDKYCDFKSPYICEKEFIETTEEVTGRSTHVEAWEV